MDDPFHDYQSRPRPANGVFSEEETRLANRNHGAILETMRLDVTPTGAHYLLTHFDVPLIDEDAFQLTMTGAFNAPGRVTMDEIRAMASVTMPVTLECSGNGRALMDGRNFSMPWGVEAVGTSEWTGAPLAPLLDQFGLSGEAIEISFTGADYGFDGGVPHYFGRSLTLDQIRSMDVLLVHSMNGQPLLPQHGAPLRIIVPGWYGMASVKWLTHIEALTRPYDGFQQMNTYRFRQVADELGDPVNEMKVKSLMVAPGVPDWVSRKRYVRAGPVEVVGRAWSGAGRRIVKVEFGVDGDWIEAELSDPVGEYAWSKWSANWDANVGPHVLRCRATDVSGAVQPLEPTWNLSGFANNVVHSVDVIVSDAFGETP